MGAERDSAPTGSVKNTGVEEHSSVKESYAAINKKTEGAMRILSAICVPRGIQDLERSDWKSSCTSLIISPKERNVVAVVTAKRISRQQRQWKATVKVILSKLSPATALRKARDCYVRSVGNFATNVGSSAACGAAYGAGPIDTLPASWKSASNRYPVDMLEPGTGLSAAFRLSLSETQPPQSWRNYSAVHQLPPKSTTASRSFRVSSARVYASSKCGMQPMPIYTIQEAS